MNDEGLGRPSMKKLFTMAQRDIIKESDLLKQHRDEVVKMTAKILNSRGKVSCYSLGFRKIFLILQGGNQYMKEMLSSPIGENQFL